MAKIGVIGIPGSWSSETLSASFKSRSASGTLVDMQHVTLNLETGTTSSPYGDLASYDALVIKKLGLSYSPDLLDRLETLRYLSASGVKVFSNPISIAQVLDRMYCTTRMKEGNIPIPPTVITENLKSAEEAVNYFDKAVLKPLYTSKARGMVVVEAGANAQSQIRQFQSAGNRILYIQKLVGMLEKDLGLVFLGGVYIGTYARVKDGSSWNTTTVSGGRYQPYHPSQDIIDLAHRAQDLFKLDFTCVDVAETPDGPVVFEVSAFGGFRGLSEACNVSASEMYADFVMRKIA